MLRRPVESALGPSIGVVYQSPVLARLAGVQRLFKCIQNKVRGHRRADAPANNTAGGHVDHECHVQPALPCRDIRKIRHPELIRSVSLELPVDPVQRARRAPIGNRRANTLTANCATQPRGTRHRDRLLIAVRTRDPCAAANHRLARQARSDPVRQRSKCKRNVQRKVKRGRAHGEMQCASCQRANDNQPVVFRGIGETC